MTQDNILHKVLKKEITTKFKKNPRKKSTFSVFLFIKPSFKLKIINFQ